MRAVFLSCLLFWGVLPARAAFPIRRQAPEFPENNVWLGAKPLSLKRLRGRRVTLVVFLNTDNVNSLRAIKTLNQWHQRYALRGLMIIGVHTPAFSFQRNPGSVDADLRVRQVDFPVVLDNDRKIWAGYQNEGWPSFYLLDPKGRVIYDNIGEARYKELESEIRAATADLGYKTPSQEPLLAGDPPNQDCGTATPEFAVKKDALIEDFNKAGGNMTVIAAAQEGIIYKLGPLTVYEDALQLTEKNEELDFSAKAVYRGAQGLALLSSGPAKSMRFFVRQDNLWLQPANAGPEVKFDADGQSYVDVSIPRLYAVTKNANDNAHLISFAPVMAGGAFYGMSAADRCLPYAP